MYIEQGLSTHHPPHITPVPSQPFEPSQPSPTSSLSSSTSSSPTPPPTRRPAGLTNLDAIAPTSLYSRILTLLHSRGKDSHRSHVPRSSLTAERPGLNLKPALKDQKPILRVETPPLNVQRQESEVEETVSDVQNPAPNFESAIPNVERQILNVQKPTPDVERPNLNVQTSSRSTPDVERLDLNTQRPAPDVEKPTAKVQTQVSNVERLTVNVQKQTLNVGRSINFQESVFNAQRPVFTVRRSVLNVQKAVMNSQTTIIAGQTPILSSRTLVISGTRRTTLVGTRVPVYSTQGLGHGVFGPVFPPPVFTGSHRPVFRSHRLPLPEFQRSVYGFQRPGFQEAASSLQRSLLDFQGPNSGLHGLVSGSHRPCFQVRPAQGVGATFQERVHFQRRDF